MVNSFVYPEGEKAFKEIQFLDREKSPEREGGKSHRLDALARTDGGILINVEAQVNKKQDFLFRTFTYATWLFNDQFNDTEQYNERTKDNRIKTIDEFYKSLISLNLLGYFQFRDNKDYRDMILSRRNNGEDCVGRINMIFLEVPKFRKKSKEMNWEPSNKQESWMAYFAGFGGPKMQQIAEREPMIQRALEAERRFRANQQERIAYLKNRKVLMEEISDKTLEAHALEAEKKARAEEKARLEAEKSTRKLAKELLKTGTALDVVAELSKIPVEELRMLQASENVQTYENAKKAAIATAKQAMGPDSFVTTASETSFARNGKIVAVVKSDSDTVFVQQLAGNDKQGILYHIDPKNIPSGLKITPEANLSITKDDKGITIETLKKHDQSQDQGMER